MQDEFIDDQPPVGTLTPEARESLRRAMADTPATHPDKIAPMKTPITDDAANDSIVKVYETSRRLELDRAALMEALEDILNDAFDHGGPKIKAAQSALAAARANFPDA